VRFNGRRINGHFALIAIGVCLAVSSAACATRTEAPPQRALGVTASPPAAIPQLPVKPSRTVTATYQGSDTAGSLTASGEPYNPDDLTAASRTLPMGSIVKVTNPATSRSVKVRINDRGPFVHGRSLDLSKGAAKKLGIVDKGVARLKITRVRSDAVSHESDSSPPVTAPDAHQGN
jgi:rare lipoprotein A